MLQLQTQYEAQKLALSVVLIVLLLLQSAVAAAEWGALDVSSPDRVDQACAHDCTDRHAETADLSQPPAGEEGGTHCDDCEHCLGCHLAATVHNHTTHPVYEAPSRFTYLTRLIKPRPTSIDRPPIA